MKARYEDVLYTNDDIRPLLTAENRILVVVTPVNEDFINFDFYGREYGVFMLNSKYHKLGTILGRIAIIHRISRGKSTEGRHAERGSGN